MAEGRANAEMNGYRHFPHSLLGHFNQWDGRSLSLFPFPTINADEDEKRQP
jgi:hypothetical protein